MKGAIWTGFLLLGCCGAPPPVPDCASAPGGPGNKGNLYYRHDYKFHNAAGCFDADFPAPPRATQHLTHNVLGTINQVAFTATTDSGFRLVSYIELPWLMADLGGHKKIISTVEEQFLGEENAKALSSKPAEVQGYKGLLIHFRREGGDEGHAYILQVRRRVYLVVGQSTKPTPDVGMNFLKSFELDQGCIDDL